MYSTIMIFVLLSVLLIFVLRKQIQQTLNSTQRYKHILKLQSIPPVF